MALSTARHARSRQGCGRARRPARLSYALEVAQDHRAVKQVTRPMREFKVFEVA